MNLPPDKAVFIKTCAFVTGAASLIGWAFGSLLWGIFAGLVASLAIYLWGDA